MKQLFLGEKEEKSILEKLQFSGIKISSMKIEGVLEEHEPCYCLDETIAGLEGKESKARIIVR